MVNEQKIKVTAHCYFDMWDRLKILFGRIVSVETTVMIPQEKEIEMYNANSKIEFYKKSKHSIEQDKPQYGYTAPMHPTSELQPS